MTREQGLTRSELCKRAKCMPYVVSYLRDCDRLPLLTERSGAGHHILYDPSAIEVIKAHLSKRKNGPGRD